MNHASRAQPLPPRSRGWWGALALVAVILVPCGILALLATAYWVDVRLADVSGLHAAATVRTRDVQPGDDVYIQTWALGRGGEVRYATGKLVVVRGAKELHNIPVRGAENPTITLPADLVPSDDVRVLLEVNGSARERGRYREDFAERIELPISVSESVLPGKLIHYAMVAIAWLIATGLSYLVLRSRYGLADLLKRTERQTSRSGQPILSMICILFVLALLALGHLVFVRPLLMTTAEGSSMLSALLGSLWILGLIGGGYAGTKQRKRCVNPTWRQPRRPSYRRAFSQRTSTRTAAGR